MKLINSLLGLAATVFALGFVYIWLFVPEQKQEMQDWWYRMTIDCDQMHSEVLRDQDCKISDDCELARKESIRAEKLLVQYGKYCGKL